MENKIETKKENTKTQQEHEDKMQAVQKLTMLCAVLFLFISLFVRSCQEDECNPTQKDSFNWFTGVCSRQEPASNFDSVMYNTPVENRYDNGAGWNKENWYDIEVDKSLNQDGSYDVTVTALMKDHNLLPDQITATKTKRKVVFRNIKPTENCIDLVVNDEGTKIECISSTKAEGQIEAVKKQIEETEKKSELKSVNKAEAAKTPEEICLKGYLGAEYKDGKCIFPVKDRMNGRAGLEEYFTSCQINKIIAGKNNTATVHAVCSGVPAIINVKRYYQKGR